MVRFMEVVCVFLIKCWNKTHEIVCIKTWLNGIKKKHMPHLMAYRSWYPCEFRSSTVKKCETCTPKNQHAYIAKKTSTKGFSFQSLLVWNASGQFIRLFKLELLSIYSQFKKFGTEPWNKTVKDHWFFQVKQYKPMATGFEIWGFFGQFCSLGKNKDGQASVEKLF